jgi:hypothetical protein
MWNLEFIGDAFDINDKGQIVGISYTPGPRAYVLTPPLKLRVFVPRVWPIPFPPIPDIPRPIIKSPVKVIQRKQQAAPRKKQAAPRKKQASVRARKS